MLATVLNVRSTLPGTWHYDYGMTAKRHQTLLADFPERNSFKHPDSETALSLFMFGNMDAWRQIGQPTGPRNATGKWSQSLFASLCGGSTASAHQASSCWPHLNKGVFCDTTLNWPCALLMFEFRIMNSAFHSVNMQPFKKLSFLDIKDNAQWGTFDAFMVVPAIQPTQERRGVLIGIEAKLKSDVSRDTKGFEYVNQVMRNLEAGYWLTHEETSLYRTWEFHYVFVCPRLPFELKSTLYSWMLFDRTAKEQAVERYRAVLQHHGANVDQRHFDSFGQMVRDRATVLHWDQLSQALEHGQTAFWSEYLDKLRGHPDLVVVLGATLERLKSAGISAQLAGNNG